MKNSIQSRVLTVCLTVVVGLSALSYRLVCLQWNTDSTKKSVSPGRSVRYPLLAQTGYIVDRNDEIIARNNPVTTIIVDKQNLASASVVAAGVAYASAVLREDWAQASEQKQDKILGSIRHRVMSEMSDEEIVEQHLSFMISLLTPYLDYPSREALRARIGKLGRGEQIIAKEIPEEIADKLQDAVRDNRIQCLHFKKSYRRIYTNPDLAAHVVGIYSHDRKGVSGIEKSMSASLQGRDGYEETMRDARNLPLGKSSGVVKPPIKGLDVKLTLDLGLQSIAEDELQNGLDFAKSERGTVIVMDPHTGEILAMASRPTYDLNLRENVATAGTNYATQAVYEPGSTFKLIATSAAIELGLMNTRSSIFCHNGILDEVKPPIKDWKGFGWLTLSQVLANSSNIGTYLIAKRVGRDRFYDFMEAYGFGTRTGIDLGGEQAGLAPRSSNKREFASKCYGYAINVTPLQVANAYSVVANGGHLMRPLIVKATLAPNGQVLKSYEPEVIRDVLSERTARLMREALSTVTEKGGTATRAAVPGFWVAGKTGTSKKIIAGGYADGRYVASFVGMLPAEDPKFVCVVVVDDPRITRAELGSSVGGGSIAAPIFAKVAGRVASAMNLKPTREVVGIPLASQ